MVIGETCDERDPRIQFDARILQPTQWSEVRNDFAFVVHPYEHESELDDGIFFCIEAGCFEIDDCNAAAIGRNAIIGKLRIGFGDASQHGVPRFVL
jgi:hypothetical protein